MEYQALNILLQKLAGDTILPEEETLLRDYMNGLSGDKLDALFSPQLWEAEKDRIPTAEEATATQAAYLAVALKLSLSAPAPVITLNTPWWRRRWVQAACMAGLIACFAWLFSNRHREQQLPAMAAENIVWLQTSTAKGEQRTVQLPDGSLVYLNGGSEIRYPGTFNGNKRQIQLVTGEIFLEVKRNEALPFIVKTEDKEVTVLGTSFSVQNRPKDQQITVAVKTGKVSFGNTGEEPAGQDLVLTPGRKGIFEKISGRLRQAPCPVTSIGGWRNDLFVFEDASLPAILDALEYRYGLQYRITDKSLYHKHFKATFRQRTPDEIIRILSQMGDFHYSKKDGVIVIG